MSCNIISWKTKKIENLQIPFKSFFIHKRIDWHPESHISKDLKTIYLDCGCGQTVKGYIKDEFFIVQDIDMCGEGSGTFMDFIFVDALKNSTGKLEAVTIWEDDSIIRINVDNGCYKEEEIDL